MKINQLLGVTALMGMLFSPVYVQADTVKTVKGTTVSTVQNSKVLDRLPGSTMIDVVVGLNWQNQAELKQLLQDLYDPASPFYQNWLTPQEFADRFAPSVEQVKAVTSYLKSHGLQVENVSENRLLIQVKGSAANLERAFGVQLNEYFINGERHFSNASDVQLPSSIASVVNSVIGLNDIEQMHEMSKPAPVVSNATPSGYSPQQIAAAYDFNPLYNNNYNGAGQTLAIATAYTFKQSDIDTFDATYGLPAPDVTIIPVNGSTKRLNTETTLDLERSHAVAPGAKILMYETKDAFISSFTTMFNQIATDNLAKTVSVSWGSSESGTSTSTMSQDDQIFQQMAAQGQSMYAASGDNGATDGTSGLTLDYPSSDPYVVSCGGTTLKLTSSNTRSSETAWSGAGGGTSGFFAAPSWQTSNPYYTANGLPNDGKRHAADVSLDADPNTGYSVFYNGSWSVYGGTSFVSPEMNGFTAIVNQGRAQSGKSSIGNMGSQIWNLGASNSYNTDFYDVTSGNNGGYTAGTSLDAPTGFGSIDAYALWSSLQ